LNVRDCREDLEAEPAARTLIGQLPSVVPGLLGQLHQQPWGACRRIVSRCASLAPWRLDTAPQGALFVSARVVGSRRLRRQTGCAAPLGPVAAIVSALVLAHARVAAARRASAARRGGCVSRAEHTPRTRPLPRGTQQLRARPRFITAHLYAGAVKSPTGKSDLIHSLGALGAAVRWRDMAIADIEELVETARSQGATWEPIGERLGVTRQTAVRVYGGDRERILEERRLASRMRTEVLHAAGVSAT
jgi:hypothetical protein